jgi:tetratricopeptide (TPR) repeat protein
MIKKDEKFFLTAEGPRAKMLNMHEHHLKRLTNANRNREFTTNPYFNPKFSAFIEQIDEIDKEFPYTSEHQKVLIWRGPSLQKKPLAVELIIAAALKLRGAEVKFVLCDGLLSGCLLRSIEHGHPTSKWEHQCKSCYVTGSSILKAMGLNYQTNGDLIETVKQLEVKNFSSKIPKDEIAEYHYLDCPVGLYALSSTERFFKGKCRQEDDFYEKILRYYFYSALINTEAANKALERMKPNRILMSHGIYVDWNPLFDLSVKADIPVSLWMTGYRKEHIYLRTATRDDKRNMYYISDLGWQNICSKPFDAQKEKLLDKYMEEQKIGLNYYTTLFNKPPKKQDILYQELNLPRNRPIWGIFSHLNWDAVFCFEPMLFNDANQWIMETFEKVLAIQDVIWIIKIHPAERICGTQEGVEELIKKKYSRLPEHIRIIPAESDLNTYGLLPILDGGVTIRGTVGLELSLMGKPVILAGAVHYGSKGFTYDSETKQKYFETLNRAKSIPKLNIRQIKMAKCYAYTFFIQKQIPFNWLTGGSYAENDELRLNISSVGDLKQGKDNTLDMICDRILNGGDFLLDDTISQGYKKPNHYQGAFFATHDEKILLGERLFKKGDIIGAIKQFSKALKLNNNSCEAHNNLGVCHWKLGDYFKGLKHFSRALEEDFDMNIIENCNQILKSVDKISSQGEWALAYIIFYLMSAKIR